MLLTQEKENTYKSKIIKDFMFFEKSLTESVAQSFLNFWEKEYKVKLIGVIENNFSLFKTEEFFVTKISLKKNLSVDIRNSKSMIKILFDCLGEKETLFDITKITEVEARIINSFNEFVFEDFKNILEIPSKKINENSEKINLIFSVQDNFERISKYIISLPKEVINIPKEELQEVKIDLDSLSDTKTIVDIIVGKTKMSLNELKTLSNEDIVILENSNLNKMQLKIGEQTTCFSISPDPTLIVNINNNGEDEIMDTSTISQDMWDNIQVEISAEFDKVKISLGDLKQISEGLVLDIGSVYDNKIFLKVEKKNIAQGELVIINDRYGVKIDKIFNDGKEQEYVPKEEQLPVSAEENNDTQEEFKEESNEDDFDYSDFEIEDENI